MVSLTLLNRRHVAGGEWRCDCRGGCQWLATPINEQASRCRHVVARIERVIDDVSIGSRETPPELSVISISVIRGA